MTITLTCHCGATHLELAHFPHEAHRCNCSYCQRAGALWAEVGDIAFTIVSNANQVTYNPTGLNNHYFCGTCGMQTWGDSPNWSEVYNNDGTPKPGFEAGQMPSGRTRMVNLNLAVEPIDLSTLRVIDMDGRKNW